MRARLVVLTGALCTLTGCYDFAGDLGKIGFFTNLTVDGQPWSPTAPIAAGARFAVGVADYLDRDDDDNLHVVESVRGAARPAVVTPEGTLWSGQDGARARFIYSGDVYDEFTVRFVAVDHGTVLAEPGTAAEPLAMLAGSDAVAWVGLRGARGQRLGYDRNELTAASDGAVSAWVADGDLHLSADGDPGESGTVTVRYGDRVVATMPVAIIDASDLAATRAKRTCDKCETWLVVTHDTDGARVIGDGLTWNGRPATIGGVVDLTPPTP